ncbi:xylulokinase [Granulicella tundricola]|uniref:Xylulose kinase n=1 Tax=Granulicella tundricola (strain ATCC BAA-1859 / DSM 23138 / MP5ACTX9) TaxID=1198114 RepID=E8X6Q5_GRATM|nr:xylulokinase [Granulicella tundricola]ADW71205.1 xylulokinase [Granulicella tundricola MP5ACTX9]
MYLGIDCGTQGTKALLVDENGSPLGRGYAKHLLIEGESGAREQEPKWWVEALKSSVRIALGQAGSAEVSALGVSGQQHGLVVLDEAYEVIRPAKLWNDTQTAGQNAELIELLGGRDECLRRFGILPLTGYTASKLLWMKQVEPANFKRIRHILLPHEYLNFWLTGEMKAEYGDASGTAFFDVRTRMWAREVLDAIDGRTGQLFRALPPLMGSEETVGVVLEEVARELGIPPGCIVSSGGGDNMMGAIGTGNVREGVVTMSLGTSSTVYSYQDHPSDDRTGEVAPFCSSSGGWLPLVCTMNATNVVMGTLNLLGKTVEEIELALAEIKPGADGLTFLPFLNGERTPDLPLARGSLVGISAMNYTASHLVRAAVEGVSFGILSGLNLILKGRRPEVILVIGGGARSEGWRQLLADATGASVRVPAEEESGCLGAAMQAMVAYSRAYGGAITLVEVADRCAKISADATLTPRPELREAYDRARQLYTERLHSAYPHLV